MAIEDTVNQAADKLIHAIEAYGPRATELALETGRWAAINNLVQASACLIIGGTVVFVACKTLLRAIREMNGDEVWIFAAVASVIAGIGGGGSFVVGIGGIFDMWSWVGLSHPDIYLAHKLLKL